MAKETNQLFLDENYDSFIAPLFSLPTKLPHSAWYGHVPFMFVLLKNLQPKTYVELGVHNGASFIAANSAAKLYNIKCKLYGVDTWQGDDHAGKYEGDSIYNELKTHLNENFSSSTLIRSYFSEALSKFDDGSVDLLHIDGLHTYEAVKEDYSTWLPKMSKNGVIIFHDTCVKSNGFGVYKLWEEIANADNSINFSHCSGLGVLFLNPQYSPFKDLIKLCNNSDFYYKLATNIGEGLKNKMGLADKFHINTQYLTVNKAFSLFVKTIKKSFKG